MPDLVLRFLRRFLDIEGTQHATVLGAQAFTSLIPFLVVAAVFTPGDPDLSDRIIDRFGLEGASARSVRALFADSGEVEGTLTVISVVILVLATLSFSRAMQRMYQRAYGQQPAGIKDAPLGLAWLAGVALWLVIVSPLRQTLEDVGGVLFAVVLGTFTGGVLWLWTPVILLRDADWRRLVPGALISGVLGGLLGLASSLYVPVLMTYSAERYGLIGVAFTLQSWLLVFGFVIVIGAVAGAVVTEAWARERA